MDVTVCVCESKSLHYKLINVCYKQDFYFGSATNSDTLKQ